MKHHSPDVKNLHALETANQRLSAYLKAKRSILADILDSIAPGDSLTARAKLIGVSRQTLYDWLSGKSKPNKMKAKRLAQLTGIPAEEFRP